MSVHIEAKEGEIADKIFTSGDPLRAKIYCGDFFRRTSLLQSGPRYARLYRQI